VRPLPTGGPPIETSIATGHPHCESNHRAVTLPSHRPDVRGRSGIRRKQEGDTHIHPDHPGPGRPVPGRAALGLHLPQDRRRALAGGRDLPEAANGSALFADLSGFSVLSERLMEAFGPRRGAEELTRALDRVFGALVAEVDRRDGSVLGFSGDAITAWFEGDDGTRATWAALAMRAATLALEPLASAATAGTVQLKLGIKVAIATGPARRFVVGDPAIRRFDALVGPTVDRMAAASTAARTGELLGDVPTAASAHPDGGIVDWREDGTHRFALLARPARPDSALDAAAIPTVDATPDADLPEDALAGWLPPVVAARLLESSDTLLAELRPAVSLFVGLGGMPLDGPDGPALLDRTIRWIEAVVDAQGGTPIDLTIGEKGSYLFVVFGAPVAHDDDVVRALIAAGTLRRPPAGLGPVMAPRIGVSRGRVRVGAFGGATRRTYGLQGHDVVIAARLMERAEPGEVVVSGRIAEAIAGRSRLEPLGALPIKGARLPVDIFRLPSGVTDDDVRDAGPGRGGPSVAGRATGPAVRSTLVGREPELGRLLALLDREEPSVRCAVIVGEPGLGKSRLLDDAIGVASARDVRVLRVRVDPIDRETPYAGWRPVYAELLGSGRDSDPSALRDRVAVVLPLRDRDRLALLEPVLPLGAPETASTLRLDPAARQDETHRLLVAILEAHRGSHPLLLAVDDAQWLDSLSWNLLHRVVRDVPGILTLATLRAAAEDRDEVRALLAMGVVARIPLAPMDDAAVARLAQQALGVEVLPAAVARFVTARGGGNPLHCQELVLALRDAGELLVANGRARLREGADLGTVAFPDSVEGVIGVRLDRLPARLQDLLKVASVLDGAVHADDVRALAGGTTDPHLLDGLVAADLLAPVMATDAPAERPAWAFRHAIVREVAYERLLFEQRRELHRRYAERLEGLGATDAVPDARLAHHWERAGVVARAIDHLERAGDVAFRDGGFPEAAELLTRALALAADAPAPGPAAPGPAAPGPAAPAPAASGPATATLATSAAVTPLRRAGWQWTAAQATYRLGDLRRSRALAEAALAAYDRPLPEGRAATVPVLVGQLTRQVGHRAAPARFVGRAPESEREQLRRATRACFNLAEVYYLASLRERSALAALRGLNLAERLGPSPELVEAYGAIAVICSLLGRHGVGARYLALGRAVADRIDDPFATALIAHQATLSRSGVGPAEPLLTVAAAGIDGFREIGDKGRHRDALGIAAIAAWQFGRTALSEAWFRVHIATHADDERSLGLGWAYTWLGAAALRRGDASGAADLLARASAAGQGAEGLDVTSVARQGLAALALHRMGRAAEATAAEAAAWDLVRASGGRPASHAAVDGYRGLWAIALDRVDTAPNPGARGAAFDGAREVVGLLDRYRRVYPIGRTTWLRATGELRSRQGDGPGGLAALHGALEAASGLDQRADVALAHAALARALPIGDPGRAGHRAAAIAGAAACDMAPPFGMEEGM